MPLPHAAYKLGKLPARHDTRTLKLARYTASLPPPLPQCWYQERISAWQMFANDTLGDCVAAAAGHMVMQWTAYAGTPFVPAVADIIKFYEYSGYNPADPSTDQGWDLLSALKVWRSNGVAGHKVAAYMSITPSDMEEMKLAVQLFGNVYLGVQLPLNAQNQSNWHIDDSDPAASAAGSWGGHCLIGDTEIPLLSGTSVRIRDLVGEAEAWLYSSTHGCTTPGHAHSFRRTANAASTLRIVLDSGDAFQCTPDHPIMLRDGTFQLAAKLEVGTSLMPLYKRLRTSTDYPGYEEVFQPTTGKWRLTHRMVASALKHLHRGDVVHHADFHKRNNDPANLEVMSWDEHTQLHANLPQISSLNEYARSDKGRARSAELMRQLWSNPIWREQMLKVTADNRDRGRARMICEGRCGTQAFDKEYLRSLGRRHKVNLSTIGQNIGSAQAGWREKFKNDPQFRAAVVMRCIQNSLKASKLPVTNAQRLARSRNATALNEARRAFNNHKIVAIEPGGTHEVFDLTVDEHHNFAVGSGVFVHNCIPIVGYDPELFTCVTWGALMNMSPNWTARYADEAYAVVSSDWITQAGNSPSGFDLAQLIADLSAVTTDPASATAQTPRSHY